MGVAAYNRGTKVIQRNADSDLRPPEFVLMDELNALPKNNEAAKPFGPIQFVSSHGGCWAQCPVTGYGYWYRTLREAVRAWRVTITGYVNGAWIAQP